MYGEKMRGKSRKSSLLCISSQTLHLDDRGVGSRSARSAQFSV